MPGLFEDAGFTAPVAPAAAIASGSIFKDAGFAVPKAGAPTWQDAEALETLGALDLAKAPEGPKKPGRGIKQALKDYIPHVAAAVRDTLAAPGNILASDKPSTSESVLSPAIGIAELVTGTKFPKVAAVRAAEKIGTNAQAVRRMVDAIGPENVLATTERMKSNPLLSVADVSDPVRTMTQGLIDPAQPKAHNTIVAAIKDRMQNATQATNDAYTAAMGPAPDVGRMVEGLKERARAAGREAIQPALANSKPVDVSPVVAAIDAKLKPGIQAMLDPGTKLPLSDLQQELLRFKHELMAPSGETLFDPMRLHRVQSDIGDRAFQLSQSASGKERLLGKELRGFNEQLIDQIDKAAGPVPVAPGHVRIGVQGGTKYVDVPEGRAGLEKLNDPDFIKNNAQSVDVGAYRAGRAKFKDAKDVSEAFESGFDTLKNRQGLKGALEDTPNALRSWMNNATPEEVVARRLGTRADIAQKIGGVKNGALAGETITRIEHNKDKLRILFGDAEANRLIRNMEDAHDQALTNAKLLANSKTAETLAGQKALEVPKVGGGNPLSLIVPAAAEMLGQGAGLPGVGFMASMAAKGGHMGLQKLSQINALSRNEAFARNALATGAAREETINALLSHPKVVRELKKSGNALTAP